MRKYAHQVRVSPMLNVVGAQPSTAQEIAPQLRPVIASPLTRGPLVQDPAALRPELLGAVVFLHRRIVRLHASVVDRQELTRAAVSYALCQYPAARLHAT